MTKAVGSVIAQFPLNVNGWTAIVAPVNSSYYLIIGSSDGSSMYRCTDDADPATSYQMPSGGWFSYSIPALYQRTRFSKGATVCYLKATQAGSIAIVEFYT